MMQVFNPVVSPRVEAIQFLGWKNAEEVCEAIPGAFYVPPGFSHSLRYPAEKASNGRDILTTAPEYLSLTVDGQKAFVRVVVNQWITKDNFGRLDVFSEGNFTKSFKPIAEDIVMGVS